MEFYPTLDMIEDYFKNTLQGSQFCQFHNNILGIHEDEILAYDVSVRAVAWRKELKLKKRKEEAQEADKLSGE